MENHQIEDNREVEELPRRYGVIFKGSRTGWPFAWDRCYTLEQARALKSSKPFPAGWYVAELGLTTWTKMEDR